MADLGIIFLHYDDNEVCLDHLARIEALNPSVPIKKLCMGLVGVEGCERIQDIDSFGNRWQIETVNSTDGKAAWARADLALYQWRAQAPDDEIHDRYAVFEWDTLCVQMSAEDFWRDSGAWDAPLATGEVIRRAKRPGWVWWRDIGRLPKAISEEHICGIGSFGALLISDGCLLKLTQWLDDNWFDAFSELRIGTVSSYLGFSPVVYDNFNNCRGAVLNGIHDLRQYPDLYDLAARGFWHPVKSMSSSD